MTTHAGLYSRDLHHPDRAAVDPLDQNYANGLVAVAPAWRIGALIPSFGYGRCYQCRWAWWALGYRAWEVAWNAHSQIALCRKCWNATSVEEHVQAHAWITACRDDDGQWPVIEAVVRRAASAADELIRPGDERLPEGYTTFHTTAELWDLAYTSPPVPGGWKYNHVDQVIRYLAHRLDLFPDDVKTHWAHMAMEVRGVDEILTGIGCLLTWDGLPALGYVAMVWSPASGWFAMPATTSPDAIASLVPRWSEPAPPPLAVVDELEQLFAGVDIWPRR